LGEKNRGEVSVGNAILGWQKQGNKELSFSQRLRIQEKPSARMKTELLAGCRCSVFLLRLEAPGSHRV
jgi:hypothetical protein